MTKRDNREGTLADDLILSCTGGKVTPHIAQKAIRALFRYYGGLMVYIPARKEDGKSAEKLRGVIADAVGDEAAWEIMAKIMRLYGGTQIYFQLEKKAFQKSIALEIFERHNKDGVIMEELAREHGITLAFAYRLWKVGQREKLKPSMPYLPFIELSESN